MKGFRKGLLKFLLTVLAVVTAIFIIYLWQERYAESNSKPVIISPTETISLSVESLNDHSMLLKDVIAIDVEDGDITSSIVIENISQFVDNGHCIVTYAAFDSDNNVSKITRHLFLTDYTPPQFKLSAPLEFNYSSSFDPLSVVGAIDCIDGDISDSVKMSTVNPDDDLSSVGAHMVEFTVTNSLGDTAVLEAEVDVYDKTYTETRMTPSILLSDYIVYVDQYSFVDPASLIEDISLSGVKYQLEEYQSGSISIDDNEVDYSVPGTYKVLYTCDNKEAYYGYAVLMIIVREVSR